MVPEVQPEAMSIDLGSIRMQEVRAGPVQQQLLANLQRAPQPSAPTNSDAFNATIHRLETAYASRNSLRNRKTLKSRTTQSTVAEMEDPPDPYALNDSEDSDHRQRSKRKKKRQQKTRDSKPWLPRLFNF